VDVVRGGAAQRVLGAVPVGILPFLLAAAVVVGAATRLPYDLREHDTGSHLAYIHLVMRDHTVPRSDDCWECYQPPLYYVVAAALLTVTRSALPPEKPQPGADSRGARVLQTFGAACGVGTVLFWLLTVRLLLPGRYERLIASAFVTFWPTLVIHACRIGNDALFVLFASLSLWQLVAWRRSQRTRAIVVAAFAAGLSAETKLTGLVVVLVVGTSLAAATLWRPPGRGFGWGGALAGWATLALVATAWAFTLVHWKQGRFSIRDFRSLGDNLLVADTWSAYTTFDLHSFAHDPFVHMGGGTGRDEFWNFLFRSSLFGQFISESATTTSVAFEVAALTAIFFPFVLAGLAICVARGLRRDDAGHRELVMTVCGFLAFLLLMRHTHPYAPHNDFRFILPVVLPCSVMAALTLGKVHRKLRRRWPHLAALPAWLVVAFSVTSARVADFWP
jgi:hypothetical protein